LEEWRRSLRRFDNVLANVELVPFAANNVPVAQVGFIAQDILKGSNPAGFGRREEVVAEY